MIDDTFTDIFNEEIVRELLTEINDGITEDEIVAVYNLCGNNPRNASLIYTLLKGNYDI